VTKTTPKHNKALVLEAFDTLFNKQRQRADEVEQPRAGWRDVGAVLNVAIGPESF
jgi:hypothetical protein